jgi:hypothetical protein
MAQDKGYPPLSRTVEVQIDVVDRANNPPVWDHTVYGPIYVKENEPVGGRVVSVKARSVQWSDELHFWQKKNKHDDEGTEIFKIMIFVLRISFSLILFFSEMAQWFDARIFEFFQSLNNLDRFPSHH